MVASRNGVVKKTPLIPTIQPHSTANYLPARAVVTPVTPTLPAGTVSMLTSAGSAGQAPPTTYTDTESAAPFQSADEPTEKKSAAVPLALALAALYFLG